MARCRLWCDCQCIVIGAAWRDADCGVTVNVSSTSSAITLGMLEYNQELGAGGGAPVAGGANSLTAAQLLGSLVSPSHRQQSNIVLQNIQECARPRYAIP
ncbi:hypothetical protein RRG08_034139 [Elysia crispata]|uniref:Uncharacterized protein n=1 Tax=Elysia crispata TaxID=231223 RepID=A0AAE0ZKV5_9GAST|nr:hypothetical protein RRG08_034139 [Elysia crispata]